MNIAAIPFSFPSASQEILQGGRLPAGIGGQLKEIEGQFKTTAGTFEKLLGSQLPDQVKLASSPVSGIEGGKSFAAHLIEDSRQLNANAMQEVGAVMKGENGSVHNAMIAMEEASVSFQLLVEMRNKVVESLQELMRMQI